MKVRSLLCILLAIFYLQAISCEKVEIDTADISTTKPEVIVYDSDSLKVTEYGVFKDWHNMQGGAIYRDKLVCLMATDELADETYNGFIYDLNTGEKECNLLFESVLNGRHFSMPHANQVSFGKEFYDSNSDFPLLYVSQVNGGSGRNDISGERGVLVYNLKRDINGGYTPVLVQAIIPDLNDPKITTKIGQYTPNYIVDTLKNQFLIMGYPQSSWFDLRGPQPMATLRIPSLSEGSVILFTNSDIVDSFQLDISISIQQSFIIGRKVFSTGGWIKRGSLRIIDLETKEQERLYNLYDFTNGEPQFLGIWRNRYLYYEAGTKGIMYELYFKS